nr:choloylglycine hydrolase [uncultured Methanobrevibacter sp.]
MMCTASNYITEKHYFGRNFDYEISYNERVTITPRNYEFKYRKIDDIKSHYAIIGIAAGIDGYPLYYDACNEKGLAMAGLNFAGNAVYKEFDESMINITPFELIPYILGGASSVAEARQMLDEINLVNINFADELPLSPLHWMLSDSTGEAIVVEPLEEGLKIYDNPVGVLTNNPPFDKQLFTLNDYRSLSNKNPQNTFGAGIDLDEYSRGMGAIGLPGDLSSSSRFAKVAFTRANSYSGSDEKSSVSQFFHILGSVEQQNGCTFISDPNLYEYTIYTSCYNTNDGVLYYRTYNNSQITAVSLANEDLDSGDLINYLLINEEQFNFIN